MARSLTFTYGGTDFDAELIRIDRSSLYGSVRVITRDAKEQSCKVATLASDGKTLIPRGGTALGYVNTLGEWINRDQLQPVDLAGEALKEVDSTFSAAIELSDQQTATAVDMLDHSARLSYRLDASDGWPATFLSALEKGRIFRFGFSYRGGVGHDPAFILRDEQGAVWMLVTNANAVDYVSLEQAALCAGEVIVDEIDDDEEEDDELDFGML